MQVLFVILCWLMARSIDALIVGGGPVGLALAHGLRQRGVGVLVLERTLATSHDWSTTYSYRIDQRGIALLRTCGLLPELEEKGVPSTGFDLTTWFPDGTSKEVVNARASMALGYWIQRPALLALLAESLRDEMLEGELTSLTFDAGLATAQVQIGDEVLRVTSRFVFGCDGAKSAVRAKLQAVSAECMADFEPRVLDTPSSGLVYRAVLATPPDEFHPHKIHRIAGKSGQSVAMLPFSGARGEPRPLSFARTADSILHNLATPDAVYAYLDEEFPQLEARKRLSFAAASAWCSSPGSTFPRARWCNRASVVVSGVGAALLGDSLHSFPPDLGQGVNSGFTDVAALLECWPSDHADPAAVQRCFEAFNIRQAPEAEAICRLLPVGMPYQYNVGKTFAEYLFLAGLLGRMFIHKLCPLIFDPPVVTLVTQAPPLKYTECFARHRRNDQRIVLSLGLGLAMCLLSTWRFSARRRNT
uniref:FAD-binding domain-containing protein n=1 Tax=Noctiluca scintillans TaxID=2966 RepID=A0A7S1AC20_NOCSC